MQTTYDLLRARAEAEPERALVRIRGQREWRAVTAAEGLEAVARLAGGLGARGLRAGDRVAILSENRWEWVLTDLALRHLGATTVALYPTDHPANWAEILADSGARALFVSGELAERARELAGAADLAAIVGYDGPGEGRAALHELLAAEPLPAVEQRGEDLATIIYTSGTTGRPKGAMLTNDNLSSNAAGAVDRFAIGPTDRYLSFLPLSHAFERTAVSAMLRAGACVHFGRGLAEITGDLKEVSPTIVCSVPRVLEKVAARVHEQLASAGALQRNAFHVMTAVTGALGESEGDWRGQARHRLGTTLFRKIHDVFGGHLRYVVSGGARLAPEVAAFFTRVGITVYEGYGITECSPIVAACHGSRTRIGSVGEPFPGVEVRIAADGEILVRGPCVMRGYWRNDVATRETIDPEGWFHTGDLGALGPDGMLSVTGRKKELFVTSGGKNVAPVHVESALERSPLILQACAVGDGRKFVSALVYLDRAELERRLGARGAAMPPPSELARSPEVIALVQAEVDAANAGLAHHEQVRRFAVLPEELTIENGLLTPTLKMKRGPIESRYAPVVEEIYNGAGVAL